MDTNAVVASAAVGAVVATVTTLAYDRFRKFQNAKEHKLEVAEAAREAHTRGFYEGRESILQDLQPKVELTKEFVG